MGSKFRTRRRYRLTFVNENTFNAVWTLRLSRFKVWALSAVCVAAIGALAAWLIAGTPLSYLLPGYLRPDQRVATVDNTLRVDSLMEQVQTQNRFLENVLAIVRGDTADSRTLAVAAAPAVSDTLLAASEAERAFVANWTERERYNLSVLTPVVAEGMMFQSPVGVAAGDTLLGGQVLELRCPRRATVGAVHAATVVDVYPSAVSGRVVILQHINNFLSRYDGLDEVFVSPGQKVSGGQALGMLGADGRLGLSLWHDGVAADPRAVIPM